MSQRISDTNLSNLSAFVAKEMGLLFPRERWGDLERGIVAAAPHFGFEATHECIRWLLSAPLTRPQIEILAGFLTVGETYFLRDPPTLEIFETEILPAFLRSRSGTDRRLRIWSAGCASGEEPYSIAILLHRLIPNIKQWNITVVATDINPAALQKAVAGVYGKWSFRGTPSWFQKLYFTAEEHGRFRVSEQIRLMVSFEYLNLAEDSYPSLSSNTNAMDIIFCRNVLMYFTPETVRKVAGKLQRSLVDGGWLIVGPVEYSAVAHDGLEAVSYGSVTCYRKTVQEHPAAQEPVRAPPALSETLPEPARKPQPEIEAGAEAPAAAPAALHPSFEAAWALYRQGLYPQAAALLTELSAGGLPTEAMTLLIRSQANQGKLSEALSLCDQAVARDKLDPALYYLRAEILQEQGMFEEARVSLSRALYLDPKLVLAHFALGNLTLWRGNPEKAGKHFENALALLNDFAPEDILAGSEGMTAGRLREIILRIPAGPKAAGVTRGASP